MDFSYQEAATYLRIHGVELDEEDQGTRKTNQVEKEVKKEYLSYEETREVHKTMVEEYGEKQAFKVLRNYPNVRETLHTNPKI